MDDTWPDEVVDGELHEVDRARVKAELDPTERLLWLGRPCPKIKPLGRGFWIFVALDLLATAGGLACLAQSRGVGPAPGQNLLEGGAVCLGIAAVLAFLLWAVVVNRRTKAKRLAATLYALTDRRAIIWKPTVGAGGVEVHSIARDGVKRVHRVEYPDGSGDVIFTNPVEAEAYLLPFGFEKVHEVVRVERLVREALLSDERT